MEIQPDFKELLKSFNARKVDFLIVGAYALALHGLPRATGDMDLLVKPDKQNAMKILAALGDFGFGSLGLKEEDFFQPERVVQLGVPPVRVDILSGISGVSWEQAWDGRVPGRYGDEPVFFLGRKQMVENKRAAGRKKDLADLESLGES